VSDRPGTALDAAAMRLAYDTQLRDRVPDPLPEAMQVERDGPLVRLVTPRGGMVVYRDLGGLDGQELDILIARQVEVFRALDIEFEWKLHGHDLPADLPDRLVAAGFVPDERETVVVARVADIAGTPAALPPGVTLREVTRRVDFDRIASFEERIWGQDRFGLAEMLESEREADPGAITIVVAEAGDDVVCAAWVRFEQGTAFATLWGGATLPDWRRRGIYRATVAHRAGLAASRGFRYLEVDASDDSRPILERLGFIPITTTTPYNREPAATFG
jgi:GNAT superfamily N-acetyltransferase